MFRLRAVTDELETAKHLANGEKANNLSGDNTDRLPLCSRHASYLVEDVDRLGGVGLDRGDEAAGVTSGV